MHYDYKKQLRSFGYAWKGIRSCVGKEQNLSFHLITTVCVVTAGWCFCITRGEWIAIVLCIGMVIAAELFNSAIERLVDFVLCCFTGSFVTNRRSGVGVRSGGDCRRADNFYTLSYPFLLIIRACSENEHKYRQYQCTYRQCVFTYRHFVLAIHDAHSPCTSY